MFLKSFRAIALAMGFIGAVAFAAAPAFALQACPGTFSGCKLSGVHITYGTTGATVECDYTCA
ncbi:MAG: hypothetical protein KGN02_13910 [bacterium]|nr:hypothetical protein [bacterium]